MLDWISDIWEMVKSVIQTIGTSLDELVTKIDSVQFDNENVLYEFVGMVRYVIRDPILLTDVLFVLIMSLIEIGILLTLYRLIIIVIDVISNLIPGLKGRINIR